MRMSLPPRQAIVTFELQNLMRSMKNDYSL